MLISAFHTEMLIESKKTRQIPGEPFRRWFSGNNMDLIVWYNEERTVISGFQLCYKNSSVEKAITWRKGKGYSHSTCDDGEGETGQYKMTPILIPNGPFNNQKVLEMFQANCQKLEKELAELVRCKIMECPPNCNRKIVRKTGCPIRTFEKSPTIICL